MPVFKTAVRMIFRYPMYILIYIVMFGFLGLVVTGAPSSEVTGVVDYDAPLPEVAIIDRDHSLVSEGLVDYLVGRATLVDLPDQTRAMQDAIATGEVQYLLFIPAGYGDEFIRSAQAGGSVPELQCVVSVAEVSGTLIDAEISSYLNALRISAMGFSELSITELVSKAQSIAAQNASLTVVQSTEQINRASLLPFYFRWSSYPLTSGIAILVAMIFASFQTGELRRRNLSTPVSPTVMNLQIAASCLVIALLTWAFVCILAMTPIVGGLDLLRLNSAAMLLIMVLALVYCLVPLAIGFLFSQFGLNETAINGFVNITSLAMMFLSGIMMGGSDFLQGILLKIARFVPSYWYSEAVGAIASASEYTFDSLGYYFMCMGLIVLFAAAVFSVALLIGRLRAQTNEAGGNTAAETVLA